MKFQGDITAIPITEAAQNIRANRKNRILVANVVDQERQIAFHDEKIISYKDNPGFSLTRWLEEKQSSNLWSKPYGASIRDKNARRIRLLVVAKSHQPRPTTRTPRKLETMGKEKKGSDTQKLRKPPEHTLDIHFEEQWGIIRELPQCLSIFQEAIIPTYRIRVVDDPETAGLTIQCHGLG